MAKGKTEDNMKFEYICPKCGEGAIKTSNKMLGVYVNCENCKLEIKLEDEKRYKKL